jgi:hypothetical protein
VSESALSPTDISANSSVRELQHGTQTETNVTHTGTDTSEIGMNGTQASTKGTQAATNGTQSSTNGTQATTNGTQAATNGTQAATNGTQLETNSTQSDKTNQTARAGAHDQPPPGVSIFFVNDLQYDIFPVHPENGSLCSTDQGKYSCLFNQLF